VAPIIPAVTTYDDVFEHLDAAALPERQQRILVVIRDWVVQHGYSPSTRQIGEAVGLRSSSTVSRHLAALEEKGFLRRSDTVARAIDVRAFLRGSAAEPAGDSVPVPVVGDIAAGVPIAAEQHVDDTLTLPRELIGRGNVFGLRVRGESMVDAAICDGDIVVVRQQQEAHSGQIVAAMIDGDEAVVLGVVVSVLRSM
jgi:repressor LexA